MTQSYKFWDRIAKIYAKQAVPDEGVYRRKLEISRDYFKSTMTVMEFGCGTGTTAIAHAPYVKQIHAIDVSNKMLAIARGKAEIAQITNVSFEQSTIDDYTGKDHRPDAIMGHSILHLLDNKDTVIAKVYDLLKPGGVFISSTPCLGRNHKFLQTLLPLGKFLGILPNVQFFTEPDLQQSLTAAGFKIEHQWQPGEGKAMFLVARK